MAAPDQSPKISIPLVTREPSRPGPSTAPNADHLPLYRQAQIYTRQGVDLDRSTLADWVGQAAFELRPVYDILMADLKRSTKLFMDETRAPVLDPGARKTRTGYFWALARDDRPWGGTAPSGVAFTYAPGRGGQHAERIVQGFGGMPHRSMDTPVTTG